MHFNTMIDSNPATQSLILTIVIQYIKNNIPMLILLHKVPFQIFSQGIPFGTLAYTSYYAVQRKYCIIMIYYDLGIRPVARLAD